MEAITRRQFLGSSALGFAALSVGVDSDSQERRNVGKYRVYSHLLDPREHPDYTRRHVQAPTWDTFGHRTHFATLRGFGIENGVLVNYAQKLDEFTQKYDLGDVIWPSYPVIFAKNLGDLADEINRRGLYLFDIWGYTPGSGPGGFWAQFVPPQGVFEMLPSKLGEHWLGMDTGEEDGRYIGGYAPQMSPTSLSRYEQYLNFTRYFERYTTVQGNKMSTLVTLGFGHYFLKEGIYTFIGSETAQALPNAQIFYAFNRGAGKQYGVPWFGNASIFNRWGYKTYGRSSPDNGPTKGASLSLLKRLMYSQILYNSMIVGFDQQWFYNEQESASGEGDIGNGKLSPIGQIQQAARRWTSRVGHPGAMLTPVALMLDLYAGWTFPRHLYSENVYRVWGNLPYGPGDYLTDGVLDMLFPGYQDSSFYHDESGFLTPAPYGECADCILSDAEAWLLDRYPLLVIVGELEGGPEIADKFQSYIERGGHLIITAGNLARLPHGLVGIEVAGPLKQFPVGASVLVGATELDKDKSFCLFPLSLPSGAFILARTSALPAAIEVRHGAGRITVLASPFGISAETAAGASVALSSNLQNQVDKPLAKPYPLLDHVRAVLHEAFRSQMLFEVGQGLNLITCRKGSGEYTLGVSNNTWRQQPLEIISHIGPIQSLQEIQIDQSEKGAVGYMPEGLEHVDVGRSGEHSIAGGDIRVFAVRVREERVEEIPHNFPPPRPRGRFLTLRGDGMIEEGILARPSFFEHFNGVVVDWTYLMRRDKDQIQKEAGWIDRQRLQIIVDLSSGINLFPDLRLVDNVAEDYLASMAIIKEVLIRSKILHVREIILSLHRVPENNFTTEQTWSSFQSTFRHLVVEAANNGITLHLRMSPGKLPVDLEEAIKFIDKVDAPNFRLAPSTALMLAKRTDLNQAAALLKEKVGLWLVSAPKTDVAGVLWNANAPIAEYKDSQRLAKILAIAPRAPQLLDAVYNTKDEEYLDSRALSSLMSGT
jgi:hypothetical protein